MKIGTVLLITIVIVAGLPVLVAGAEMEPLLVIEPSRKNPRNSEGDLLCVWNDHSGIHEYPAGRRTPLCMAISPDEGKTWSRSRVIEDNPDGWYCYTAISLVKDRAMLAYCAGDKEVGGLNRLKVLAIPKDWLISSAFK